jgi:hypothetical protein
MHAKSSNLKGPGATPGFRRQLKPLGQVLTFRSWIHVLGNVTGTLGNLSWSSRNPPGPPLGIEEGGNGGDMAGPFLFPLRNWHLFHGSISRSRGLRTGSGKLLKVPPGKPPENESSASAAALLTVSVEDPIKRL